MKDYTIPINTTNHLLLDLANLKKSHEMVECTWLAEEVSWARNAKEVIGLDMPLAAKASHEAVSPDAGALHPMFAATSDDWMYPEDISNEYEEGEPPQSQE